jgi:HSP20 family protein
MNIVTWGPFREMDDIFNRYQSLLNRNNNGESSALSGDWRPAADISETDKEYLIKADLPEVDRKDVHVSVENGSVTISGERTMNNEEKDATQHRIESFYGSFSRSFALPSNVNADKITAKSENGVLKVHLPKVKETRPKPVEIDVK